MIQYIYSIPCYQIQKRNSLKTCQVCKFERHKSIVLVLQVRIESELGTFWTYQNRRDNGISFLNLSNVYGPDIVDVLLPVYIVHSYCTFDITFLILSIIFFYFRPKKGGGM